MDSKNRWLILAVLLLLSPFIATAYAFPSGETYPPTFREKDGWWYDSWDVCRNHAGGEDGYLPSIVFESLENNKERAFQIGQQFLDSYPDREMRALAILQYVTTWMKYGYDEEWVFIDGVPQEEWAWNPDEMAHMVEGARQNYEVARGDCEDFSFFCTVLYLTAGYDVLIVDAVGHVALMIWLPEYANANAYWNVPDDGRENGWVWIEATSGTTRNFGRTPDEYFAHQFKRVWSLGEFTGNDLFLGKLRKKGDVCIIATTTYGSELAPEVQFLREFRDRLVLSTFAGSQFMEVFNAWYYSFSTEVAESIDQHPEVKALVKITLYPLIGILHFSSGIYHLFSFQPEFGIVMAGLVASILIGIFYFSLPVAAILVVVAKMLSRQKLLAGHNVLTIASFPLLLSMVMMGISGCCRSQPLMMGSTATFVLTLVFTSALIVGSKVGQKSSSILKRFSS